MLVVIIVIALLAAVLLGALAKTREAARADATKATIAKLNDLVMRKYQSYHEPPRAGEPVGHVAGASGTNATRAHSAT